MKKSIWVGFAVGGLLVGSVASAEWTDTLQKYNCLEVKKFDVDRDDFSNRGKERAAAVPDKTLTSLQHKIVGDVTRKKILPQVVKAEQAECQGRALIFGGQVTDYKEGSRAARIFIGLGAGKQKFEVECYIKDKATGKTLATKKVVDRKVGGLAGGDEEKGERDFAEKVSKFLRQGG